jgi:hypothetical protein
MYWFCKRVAINWLICFIPVSPVLGELVVDDLNVELVADVKLSDPTKILIHFVRFITAFTFEWNVFASYLVVWQWPYYLCACECQNNGQIPAWQ